MSWRAAGKVKELTENLTRSEKLLLLVLADYHNDDTGRCDPSIASLARAGLMSKRTVSRVTQSLAEKGFIAIQDRHTQHRANQYDLLCLGGRLMTPCHQGAHDTHVMRAHDTAMSPEPKGRTVNTDRRQASSKPSSDQPPLAALQARFLAATKVNERVAVVVDLFTQQDVKLTAEQKAHLGSLLRRRGHGIAVWRTALAATTAEGDPIEFLEGGTRNAKARSSGPRARARVTDATDLADAKKRW